MDGCVPTNADEALHELPLFSIDWLALPPLPPKAVAEVLPEFPVDVPPLVALAVPLPPSQSQSWCCSAWVFDLLLFVGELLVVEQAPDDALPLPLPVPLLLPLALEEQLDVSPDGSPGGSETPALLVFAEFPEPDMLWLALPPLPPWAYAVALPELPELLELPLVALAVALPPSQWQSWCCSAELLDWLLFEGELLVVVQLPDVAEPLPLPLPLLPLLELVEQLDVSAKTWCDSTSCTATNASAAAPSAKAPLTRTCLAVLTIVLDLLVSDGDVATPHTWGGGRCLDVNCDVLGGCRPPGGGLPGGARPERPRSDCHAGGNPSGNLPEMGWLTSGTPCSARTGTRRNPGSVNEDASATAPPKSGWSARWTALFSVVRISATSRRHAIRPARRSRLPARAATTAACPAAVSVATNQQAPRRLRSAAAEQRAAARSTVARAMRPARAAMAVTAAAMLIRKASRTVLPARTS
ncbi:MAG: hypothetical protein JOY68_11380 [Candidatus Dormibacteraeota bacterium]|nr:hypothetical protein [Candidatus Dormibacteraeota bacterium]